METCLHTEGGVQLGFQLNKMSEKFEMLFDHTDQYEHVGWEIYNRCMVLTFLG